MGSKNRERRIKDGRITLMDYEERIKRRDTLKQLLLKHGDWEIDICENVEVKDSEILLRVIEEFNEIFKP